MASEQHATGDQSKQAVAGASAEWGVIGFALVYPSVLTLVYFVLLASQAAMLQQAAYLVGKLIQFSLPVVWVVGILQQPPRPRLGRPVGIAIGLATGAAIVGAMMVLYRLWVADLSIIATAEQAAREKMTGFQVTTTARYALLATFYSLAHSLLEEYYWRWFVFGRLRQHAGLATSIAVSSVGFMAHHVILLGVYFGWTSPATILFSLGVGIGGALWAWLYERSGSLVGPWLSHLLVDAGIFWIGYEMVRPMLDK